MNHYTVTYENKTGAFDSCAIRAKDVDEVKKQFYEDFDPSFVIFKITQTRWNGKNYEQIIIQMTSGNSDTPEKTNTFQFFDRSLSK